MEEYEKYLDFAKEIAKEAGNIMKKYFDRRDVSSYKGDRTIVTLADTEINSYLIEKVKEKFPGHCVDGEEEQFGESRYVWVCDPVDGTAMYARSIPVAVFSLALVVDGVSMLGVIYDPFTDNVYTAIKGKGAYQNDKNRNLTLIVRFLFFLTYINKKIFIYLMYSILRAQWCHVSRVFP